MKADSPRKRTELAPSSARSGQLNQPTTRKRGSAVISGLMLGSASKTRPTAEGGIKKGQFYKPLAKEFHRDGFQYRQIAREGNAAIYEQAWLGCTEPSRSYEVVRIRRRQGFQIGNRFVNAAEVYPNSEGWGGDGFTFTSRNKAGASFLKMSLEEPARRGKEVK
jgi:hypothetical protein